MRFLSLGLLGVMLATAAAAQESTATSASLSAQQVKAYNVAVAYFSVGQKAQQSGDNSGALSNYELALPAIRDAVETQPDNIDNVKFLANILYVAAVAKASIANFDAAIPLLEESLPYWRKVVGKDDSQSRDLLTSILTQLGNAELAKKDKLGAGPYYTEAVSLGREAVSASSDPQSRNLLLGALIGASQASGEASTRAEAERLARSMIADGSVNAVNLPAARILAGS